MITCEQLDGVTEQLCDLTREMPDLDRIREATELLEMVERLPRKFVMQWRAAAAADLHYLRGVSMRDIARQLGNAFQGVSQWLQTHGPTHYLLVRKDPGRPAELKLLTVDGEHTKVKLRQHRDAGYLVAPATLNLVDGSRVDPNLDPERLWIQLSPAEPEPQQPEPAR